MRRKVFWLTMAMTGAFWLGCASQQDGPNRPVRYEVAEVPPAPAPAARDVDLSDEPALQALSDRPIAMRNVDMLDRSDWQPQTVAIERATVTHQPTYFEENWVRHHDRPSPLLAQSNQPGVEAARALAGSDWHVTRFMIAETFVGPVETGVTLGLLPIDLVRKHPWKTIHTSLPPHTPNTYHTQPAPVENSDHNPADTESMDTGTADPEAPIEIE